MTAMAARADLVDTSILEAARGLDRAFERAARAGDPAQLAQACYSDTGRLVPPNGPGVRGLDQIRACWRSVLDAGLADVALDTPDVVSTGDVAYGIGRYTLVYRPVGGGAVRDAGRRVVAYRRRVDGRLAITADIWTSDGAQADPSETGAPAYGARWRGCRRGSPSAHGECRDPRGRGCRPTRSDVRGGARS